MPAPAGWSGRGIGGLATRTLGLLRGRLRWPDGRRARTNSTIGREPRRPRRRSAGGRRRRKWRSRRAKPITPWRRASIDSTVPALPRMEDPAAHRGAPRVGTRMAERGCAMVGWPAVTGQPVGDVVGVVVAEEMPVEDDDPPAPLVEGDGLAVPLLGVSWPSQARRTPARRPRRRWNGRRVPCRSGRSCRATTLCLTAGRAGCQEHRRAGLEFTPMCAGRGQGRGDAASHG